MIDARAKRVFVRQEKIDEESEDSRESEEDPTISEMARDLQMENIEY